MKTNLLILFFLMVSVHFYGQTVAATKNDWIIGLKFSFDNSSSSKTISNAQYIGYFLEYDKPNYTSGITVERKLNDKFLINTGLEYSNKDYTGTYYCETCQFIVAPLPQSFELRFLQIPINIKYEYPLNSFSLFASSGITNAFTIKKDLNEKNYLLEGNIGLGIGYKVKNNWIFELSTAYTKSFIDRYSSVSFDQEYTGIIISIKKKL